MTKLLDWFSVDISRRQTGLPPSPTLFTIYIDDLAIGIQSDSRRISTLDDVFLMVVKEQDLQKQFNTSHTCCSKCASTKKSNVIQFRNNSLEQNLTSS